MSTATSSTRMPSHHPELKHYPPTGPHMKLGSHLRQRNFSTHATKCLRGRLTPFLTSGQPHLSNTMTVLCSLATATYMELLIQLLLVMCPGRLSQCPIAEPDQLRTFRHGWPLNMMCGSTIHIYWFTICFQTLTLLPRLNMSRIRTIWMIINAVTRIFSLVIGLGSKQ